MHTHSFKAEISSSSCSFAAASLEWRRHQSLEVERAWASWDSWEQTHMSPHKLEFVCVSQVISLLGYIYVLGNVCTSDKSRKELQDKHYKWEKSLYCPLHALCKTLPWCNSKWKQTHVARGHLRISCLCVLLEHWTQQQSACTSLELDLH